LGNSEPIVLNLDCKKAETPSFKNKIKYIKKSEIQEVDQSKVQIFKINKNTISRLKNEEK